MTVGEIMRSCLVSCSRQAEEPIPRSRKVDGSGKPEPGPMTRIHFRAENDNRMACAGALAVSFSPDHCSILF